MSESAGLVPIGALFFLLTILPILGAPACAGMERNAGFWRCPAPPPLPAESEVPAGSRAVIWIGTPRDTGTVQLLGLSLALPLRASMYNVFWEGGLGAGFGWSP